MDTGDVFRKIIVNPDNYEEMLAKLEGRDEERMKKTLEKKGVQSKEDLQKIAEKEITARSQRASHKPIKDHTVKTEAQSSEILELKKQLHEEISAFAKTRLAQTTMAEKPEGLKGRVSPGSPEKGV